MGILIGPTPWWQATIVSACPVGTTLPDGSRLICKAGGTAWIVAPSTTQVGSSWNNSTSTLVGNKCCVCDWPTLCTQMISCGFNPADWFIPTPAQLQNPGYVCRTQWDTFSLTNFWSSTENNATYGCRLNFNNNCQQFPCPSCKTGNLCVRAFRCVTY
jgi:hypothetical protein